MKNEKIERMIKSQRKFIARGGLKMPVMIPKSGIFTYVDFDYKFASEYPQQRQYCEFDIIVGGRCYSVNAVNCDGKLTDISHDIAQKIVDAETFPNYIDENQEIDFVKAVKEMSSDEMNFMMTTLFGNDDHLEKIITKSKEIAKTLERPVQSIDVKMRPHYNLVRVVVDMTFDSYDGVYKLRDAVIQYLRTRNLTEFYAATRTVD